MNYQKYLIAEIPILLETIELTEKKRKYMLGEVCLTRI